MPGVVLACQPIKALHGLPFRWRDLPGQAAGLGIRRPWWFDACLLLNMVSTIVNVVVAAAMTIYFSGCDGDDDEHNQHYDQH